MLAPVVLLAFTDALAKTEILDGLPAFVHKRRRLAGVPGAVKRTRSTALLACRVDTDVTFYTSNGGQDGASAVGGRRGPCGFRAARTALSSTTHPKGLLTV